MVLFGLSKKKSSWPDDRAVRKLLQWTFSQRLIHFNGGSIDFRLYNLLNGGSVEGSINGESVKDVRNLHAYSAIISQYQL